MGTTASVDADSDGPEVTSQQPTRRPLHHGSADHVWKKVAAIRMAAKGFKILRPGRKIDFKNVVVINKSGFSVSSLNLVAGEVVAFVWDDPEGNGYNVVQVIHDGEQFRPVPGGVYSGPVQREGHFEYLFQIEGEYKFFSSGLRCTPLTIQVSPRLDIQVELREECFYPSVIHIERGNTVKWNWQMSSVPMAMYEVQYCFRHCSTVDPPDKASIIATTTGNFKKQFKQEGVYYFQSYSSEQSAKTHYCVVHVKRVSREHKIDIMDTMFRPPILLIEEGDKVWWRWSREECRKPHCLYQVEAPEVDHRSDESYIPSENGFRWPQPTKNGQMSQTFEECGIYYYSDYNDDEAAEYLGTIIVKPKQKDHLIELGADGFTPDLLRVKAGDRVWWRWEPREMGGDFALMEVEKCLCANQRTPIAEFDCDNKCRIMDDSAVHTKTLATVDTVQLNSVGVYHYRVADSPNSMATSSVIVQPGPRNYTVHVSDMDFDPKVLSINVGDRVWWVWQGTKNPHNIMQVSHRGQPIRNGFCSGAPLDAPSAYVQQFNESGVYYYISKSLPKFFGAIVVSTRPKVHELAVTHQDVDPDPTCVNLNDVVAWTFTGLKQYDVSIVTSPDQFVDLQAANNTVCPRRCLNRLMKEMPLFHHFSKSFWRSGKREMTKAELEARLSSVIVDDAHDCPVVRVSGQGFTPPKMNIVKGQSLLWSWREAGEEEHNIIHVSAPTSETPLSVIQGSQSFNSGKPVSKNSFLYTFDDMGTHCVASQGAPGYAGVVRVLDSDRRAADPVFQSDRLAGIVDPGHVVDIRCDTPGSKLYYTIDGTSPELHTLGSKPYNPQTGVVLKHPGLYVIRAIAVCDDLLQSRVVHSDRFWVLGEPDEEMTSEEEPMDVVDASDGKTHVNQWYTCRPIIKGCSIGPGILEVFWEPFSPEIKELIRGYQVFLNEVTYCDLFSADHHSLNVAGLAGGRTYEVYVEVYPNDEMLVPNRSNVLNPTVPVTAEGGGPLISLEATDDDQTMSIVWMSISSPDYPVAGYKLYLNGKQCGNMVVPDEDSNRCKVVIEECALDQLYRVAVLAIPDDSNQKPRLSNQLELSLPLETENITLPPDEYRSGDQDLYREYIEIREGAGFMPEESGPSVDVMESPKEAVMVAEEPMIMAEKAVSRASSAPLDAALEGMGEVERLPVPKVALTPAGPDAAIVEWECAAPEPPYKCMVYVVNVVGANFNKTVNSDISKDGFECTQELDKRPVAAVQHSWNVTDNMRCPVKGLIPGETYWIHVVAHYCRHGGALDEVQIKSSTLRYTTVGSPVVPKPVVHAIHQYQVDLSWEPLEAENSHPTSGFVVLADGKPIAQLPPDETKFVLDYLQPGESKSVQVVATSDEDVGNSRPSDPIQVCCPQNPPPPRIRQEPAYKTGSVVIGWEKPPFNSTWGEDLILYTVFVDNEHHCEVKASPAADSNGYQYQFTDLPAGMTLDVHVKAVAGQLTTDPLARQILCLSESQPSNTLTVTCPAPPESPVLRIDNMTSDGVDVTWQTPQQFGDANISGFQVLKNGKLYGSTIPPEVQSMRIKDITLGEKVTLQLIALTEHPVGRRAKIVDSDSGIAGDAVIENFGACTAGPKLTFLFTGLVQAPNKVWCEQVTGHSALIVWTKDDSIRSHHVAPDSYQVTWWPGDQAENDINSQHTVNNHLEITGLEPATVYSVVVEARKLQSYSSMQQEAVMPLGNNEVDNASFLLTSHSDKLTVQVARPPDPASNLGVVASTCHSLQVAWDPPREHGVEVIGLRLDCSPVSKHHARSPTIIELLSDVTSAIIDGLCEKNEYVITVTAMTDEFFDCLEPNHELKRIRSLRSVDAVPESCWLPRTSIIASTSGTDPPSQLSLVKMTSDSVTLTWRTAAVYGSNRLLGQVVRWSDSTRLLHPTQSQQWNSEETFLASHMNLDAKDSHVTVKGLEIGTVYHFIIEAVVSVKITAEQQMDIENEGKNRRTAHVPSKPLMVRTRAPCESPKLYVTGYTQNTIQLYWEKPILYTVLQSDGDKRPKILRRHLEGYKLLINGREHLRLAPAAQTCTLSKCKPGKEYKITLVALTCTEDVRKEKRKKLRGISADSYTSVLSGPGPRELMNGSPGSQEEEDADLDESESDVLPVTIPRALPGNIASFRASCAAVPGSSYDSSFILADWTLHGDPESVRQYNLTWCSQLNPVINRRSLGPDIHRNKVPAPDKKSVYELSINPQMYQEQTRPDEQNIQVVVAGPPDPPELFLKSVAAQEFVVEWGEPRCYGNVRVAGYQILLNDRKVGSVLNACHHKAVVPCQAHRTYRVNIIALSDTEDVEDSPKSNTVFVSTHDDGRFPAVSDRLQAAGDNDTDNMIFKVVKVTESTIQLDWSMYVDTDNVAGYRVEWSSLAQPQHKEATLGPREFSCTISKCFPGTNHFVRVMALGGNGEVVDRSRQVTVQTSAPPDTPVVNLRAVNFKYITIQWEKPQTYGDALIRGYKVFVNGIVEEEVAANQTMYSYTKGRPCCEYTFQVQALSTGGVASRHSEPLLVTLPGAKAPTLKQAAVSGNSVRVTWEKPESTEGVKCKLCKKTGSCKSCKACSGALHGTSDVIRSDPLLVRPAPSPDPPEITVTVVGLEERRQIEKILCNLLNRRDELLPVIQNNKGGDSELASKASEKLIQLESMIEDCFSSLTHYTGHLIAHVSWQAPQSDPEVAVAGYKVLVDGKQYGCSLHSGIRKVRIKLNLDQPTHRISMLALSDDPGAASAESNSVEVLSDPFQPFTFYCYRHVHQKDARYPSHGCCQYQCSYRVERRPGAKLVNIGHLRRHLAPPACHAREVFGGEYRPLYTPQGRATVILFWTRWCLASYKAARFFNRYAKEHAQTNDYCTVSCDMTEDPIAERQELIHLIMDNGWRDDTAIKHFTSESPGNDPEPSGKKRGFRGREDASSILKLYNIQGVPTVVVIHPDNYVMFQGRYCAFDYSSFELWLTSAISVKDRENGVLDMDAYDMVDHDALAHRPVDSALIHTPDFTASGLAIPRGPPSPKRGGFHAHCCPAHVQGRRRKSPPTNRPRPVSSRPASRPSSHSRTSSAASKRPVSAYRKKDNISVNIRPFSATDSSKGSGYYNSPYVGPISGSVPPRPRQWKAWEP